jgi:hypothetical protein
MYSLCTWPGPTSLSQHPPPSSLVISDRRTLARRRSSSREHRLRGPQGVPIGRFPRKSVFGPQAMTFVTTINAHLDISGSTLV